MTLDRRAVRLANDIRKIREKLQRDPECGKPGWVRDAAACLLAFEGCFVNGGVAGLVECWGSHLEQMAEKETAEAERVIAEYRAGASQRNAGLPG
jgi:hypothetical protein